MRSREGRLEGPGDGTPTYSACKAEKQFSGSNEVLTLDQSGMEPARSDAVTERGAGTA